MYPKSSTVDKKHFNIPIGFTTASEMLAAYVCGRFQRVHGSWLAQLDLIACSSAWCAVKKPQPLCIEGNGTVISDSRLPPGQANPLIIKYIRKHFHFYTNKELFMYGGGSLLLFVFFLNSFLVIPTMGMNVLGKYLIRITCCKESVEQVYFPSKQS